MGQVGTSSETTKLIWQLYSEGCAVKEIPSQVDRPISAVRSAIARGLKNGKVAKRKSAVPEIETIPKGNISNIIDELTEDQKVWLVNQINQYKMYDIAELILEIVRDAHAEQTLL